MNIGELDTRIALYSQSVSTDAWNHENKSRVLLETVWAKVTYKSGTETQTANQRVGVDKIEFLIRYRSGLSARNTEVQKGTDYYDVHSIEVIGRNEALRLITTLRDNNQ
tara:strand:- start:101 stop:427 length:327 start_codon:yes stop_codon:yes gene_type:complete